MCNMIVDRIPLDIATMLRNCSFNTCWKHLSTTWKTTVWSFDPPCESTIRSGKNTEAPAKVLRRQSRKLPELKPGPRKKLVTRAWVKFKFTIESKLNRSDSSFEAGSRSLIKINVILNAIYRDQFEHWGTVNMLSCRIALHNIEYDRRCKI